MRYWHNHYEEARDVRLDDIFDVVAANHPRPAERKAQLHKIVEHYEAIDAYIIPSPSGYHSLGARYGNLPHEYASFTTDRSPELDALLARSTPRS